MNLSTGVDTNPVGFARRAEELGFDFVSSSDHPCGDHPTNETWTLLTWIAASTDRIGVVTRVLGTPFRNPVLTAKMAETLNRMSDGRLVLGLGAGASHDEIRAMGIPVRGPGDSVRALGEAVQVIRSAWDRPDVTHEGVYYSTDRATISPRPESAIPIWLGTFGNRALELTGQSADGWIPSLGYAPEDRLGEMLARVRGAAARAGREPDAVEAVLNVEVRIGDDDAPPHVAGGDAHSVVERLVALLDIGFDGMNLMLPETTAAQQLERLGNEVLPALRHARST